MIQPVKEYYQQNAALSADGTDLVHSSRVTVLLMQTYAQHILIELAKEVGPQNVEYTTILAAMTKIDGVVVSRSVEEIEKAAGVKMSN